MIFRSHRIDRALTAAALVAAVLAALCASGCRKKKYVPEPGGASLPALVDVKALAERTKDGPKPVLLDTRLGSRYDDEHVYGALPFPADSLQPTAEERLDPTFQQQAIEAATLCGGRGDQQVVAIDDGSRAGFERAALTCWTLALAGMNRCAILDGGLPAWKKAGGAVARGPVPAPEKVENPPHPTVPQRPPALAVAEAVRNATASGDVALVDATNREPGAVPGALRLPLAKTIASDGRLDLARLETWARENGLRAETEAIVFGENASDGAAGWFLLARQLRVPVARLYPEGLAHWPLAAAAAPAEATPEATHEATHEGTTEHAP